MNEVSETGEVVRLNPECAKTFEEFDKAIEGKYNELHLGMIGDEKMHDLAKELSDRSTPEEIQKQIDGLGDQSEKLENYRNAVFGNNDLESKLSAAKFIWEDDVSKRTFLEMALGKYG